MEWLELRSPANEFMGRLTVCEFTMEQLMGDIELVVSHAKKFEALLEKRFGARGRGLHEKVSSVEAQLPAEAVKKLRYVATIRNKFVHEDNVNDLDDREGFLQTCGLVEQALRTHRAPRGRHKLMLAVVLALAGVAAWAYFQLRNRLGW
jgi:hypothetical protein